MLRTNVDKLVMMAVQGRVAASMRFEPFEVDAEGRGHSLPSVGGITYNVKVGDPAFGWAGDHIEPAVSALIDEEKRSSRLNQAFNFLACVGNEARVLGGDAKGARGIVTGHHGGVEHVLIDFDDAALEKMAVADKILIRAWGQGLTLTDFPQVKIYNLDPGVLQKMGISVKKGILEIPVVAKVPAALMGSGIGHPDPGTGDYDITTQDPGMVKKYGLDKLRLGDIVAITDADNTYGRHYFTGAVTIAAVVHSDSHLSGHGPGVTTLISARKGLRPVIDRSANLANLLGIGRHRARDRGASRRRRAS
ncbi:MAG: DUF4438 domain-containing protein [Deltaproteobacteria bacterium]|nr:DUF4438 domain-containing protein [Deltaproteobacteria bacterium]